MASARSLYGKEFYARQQDGARQSASVVVPLVNAWLRPTCVLDVGCGVGAWLGVWRSLGVEDVVGIDGDHVDRTLLQIPPDRFLARDLVVPVDLGRSFDLVMSLEVAEHLPATAADVFVETLVRHGRVVLFSAAIPGQGGSGHLNEEWPEAWARRFARHGYRWADPLRPRLWNDPGVESWYAQNAILYYRPEALPVPPWEAASGPGGSGGATEWPLPLVHPHTAQRAQRPRGSVRRAWRDLRRALWAAVFGPRHDDD